MRWYLHPPPPHPAAPASLPLPAAVLIGYVVYPTQQLTSGVRSMNVVKNLASFNNSACIKPLRSNQTEASVPDYQVGGRQQRQRAAATMWLMAARAR